METKNELINLNTTLAKVIRDYLIEFKKMNRGGIIYEVDGENKTEWFLDELIWTFNTVYLGGATEDEKPRKIWDEITFGATNKDKPEDVLNEIKSLYSNPKMRIWEKEVRQTQERINEGLRLFSIYFEGLWD